MWAWAGEGLQDDAAFAALREEILATPSGASLRASMLQAEHGELSLTVDTFRPRLVARKGQTPQPDSAWSVNGQPWRPSALHQLSQHFMCWKCDQKMRQPLPVLLAAIQQTHVRDIAMGSAPS